ncbi:MAG: hypothetical protein FWF94_03005 [Oscillospiraceae bacterium]|nr:hypothetical protein [Oscillospiraceae bacterium]
MKIIILSLLIILSYVLGDFWLNYFVPFNNRWDLPPCSEPYKTIPEIIQERIKKRK